MTIISSKAGKKSKTLVLLDQEKLVPLKRSLRSFKT